MGKRWSNRAPMAPVRKDPRRSPSLRWSRRRRLLRRIRDQRRQRSCLDGADWWHPKWVEPVYVRDGRRSRGFPRAAELLVELQPVHYTQRSGDERVHPAAGRRSRRRRLSSDSDCSGGDVCGTVLSFGSAGVTQSCGKQVASWTADELCAATGNAEGGAIDCNGAVSGQGTNANLYGCNGPNSSSGYSTSASATSCGCPDWNVNGEPLTVAPGFACRRHGPRVGIGRRALGRVPEERLPNGLQLPLRRRDEHLHLRDAERERINPNSMDTRLRSAPAARMDYDVSSVNCR